MGHPNEDLIRQGYDAFSRGDMDTLRALFDPEMVHDVVANDQHGVGLHKVFAERGGRALEDNSTLVFHVRDGKVTEVWQYWADLYAADELFA